MQNLQSLEESSNFKVQLKRLFAQHIHIVDISNGCIESVIILGGLTFLAMAFVATLRMGKRFKVSARFSGTVVAAEVEAPPEPPRVHKVKTITLTGEPNGKFHITGRYETDEPAPQAQASSPGRCALL